MDTQLIFIRKNGFDIDTLVVVDFEHSLPDSSSTTILDAVKRAVTIWVNKTPEGLGVWEYSAGDLNIGDLMTHDTTPLRTFLADEGIYKMNVVAQLEDKNETPFDTKLVIVHAREVAKQIIKNDSSIRLNAEQSARFVEALLAPPRPPTRAMRESIRACRKLVKSDLTQPSPSIM